MFKFSFLILLLTTGGNILYNNRRIGRFHFSLDFFYHPPNRKVKKFIFKDHPQIPLKQKKSER